MWIGLATSSVPVAAPAMISSSAGCSSTAMCPFSIRKPPMTAPKTRTMPMMANMPASPAPDVMWLPPAWMLEIPWPLRALQQLRQRLVLAQPACAAPMLTVSEIRSPHHRKSAVLARPASACACAAKHLRRALVREDQKLIVAPPPQSPLPAAARSPAFAPPSPASPRRPVRRASCATRAPGPR